MFFDNFVSRKEWSVFELTTYLKKKVETDILLRNIYLKGEVIKPTFSGDHLYFELKDLEYDSKIKCVFFWFNKNIDIKHGLKVLVKGNIIFYDREGIVEFKANEITEIGLGEYYIRLKQLEEKLKKEGLFDEKHKKDIPRYPKRIGIVTSKNGAAVRDILNTIYSKLENIQVFIFDCAVQGQNAAIEICKGIDYFNKNLPVEVIIVGRGGGSFEDLMAFNDEMVLRKIFESKIPIISAVGHERDLVLSDFVADSSAITPTKAGEMIVYHQSDAFERLYEYILKMRLSVENRIAHCKKDYNIILYRLLQNSPSNTVAKLTQDVNIKNKKLSLLINKRLNHCKHNTGMLYERLRKENPFLLFSGYKDKYNILTSRLESSIKEVLNESNFRYKVHLEKLIALNPLNILKRGYSITFHNSEIITTIRDVNLEDEIVTYLSDGTLKSKIVDMKGNENHDRTKW